MSLNTQAFVPSASKSGKSAEGRSADGGHQSARETSAEFKALMQGMKDGGAAGTRGQADPTNDPNAGEGKATGGAGKPAGSVAFSTSNLADALRQVSQKILTKPGSADAKETRDAALSDPDAAAGLQSGGAVAGLAITAVLAVRSSPEQPDATQGTPQSSRQHQHPALANVAKVGIAPEGDGAGKMGTSSLFAQFGVEPERGNRTLLPEDAAGTVKVLRQETHFAPNMRLSPAQQIGEQITTALKEMPADSGRLQTGLTAKPEGAVLKTLDIQLTPHELGTVKVSLRMVGDTVEVSLVTSTAQTAELLKQDRQLLDQMLRATGFKADTIAIQAADDRLSVQGGNAASGNSSAGQNGFSGNNHGDGQSQNFTGGSGQQNSRPDRNGREDAFQASEALGGKAHEKTSDISLSDGIYL